MLFFSQAAVQERARQIFAALFRQIENTRHDHAYWQKRILVTRTNVGYEHPGTRMQKQYYFMKTEVLEEMAAIEWKRPMTQVEVQLLIYFHKKNYILEYLYPFHTLIISVWYYSTYLFGTFLLVQ